MDESGHRESGRQKPDMYKPAHSQWLMQQPQSMKHIMGIMAERDAAIQERNMAVNEKNKALEERDLAMLQRDTAIQERNEAIVERDNALAALQFRQNSENTINDNNNQCPPGCQVLPGVKHMHQPLHVQLPPDGEASSYGVRDVSVPDALPSTPGSGENVKSRKAKRPTKETDATSPNKKTSKPGRKSKTDSEDLNKMISKSAEWKGVEDISGEGYKQLTSPKADWKVQDLGLNQVVFDESTMPPPVCSCTGIYHQCYKWGNGGWQSSCCTTTVSMYPLPAVPNKRHARVGGRKMTGSAFSKLLSRMAGQGHDLSTPVDLKDHWAKHGTNRYITIR